MNINVTEDIEKINNLLKIIAKKIDKQYENIEQSEIFILDSKETTELFNLLSNYKSILKSFHEQSQKKYSFSIERR